MQVLFSPFVAADGSAQVSLVGVGICKSFRCTDVGGLKPVPIALSHRPDLDLTCHAWLSGGVALVFWPMCLPLDTCASLAGNEQQPWSA